MASTSFFQTSGSTPEAENSIQTNVDLAQTAATEAGSSRTASQTAQASAEAAQAASETAKSQAEIARDNANASASAALISQNSASASATSITADAVQTAADRVQTNADVTATEASASAALASQTASATSATASANSAAASAGSATASANEATDSANSASTASTQATNAASSATTATTQANNAASSASTATTQATASASSASTATTQATNSANSATASANSASLASSAQTATESARDSALAAFDSFDDRYLGVFTSANQPTTDNDGDALLAGSLYYDSTASAIQVYTGTGWTAAYVSGTGFAALNGATFTGNVTVPNLTVSGTVDGRDVSVDGAKLDGIEASADVTDATNVAAAGALMTAGGTMSGDINFGDDDKAQFGAGNDLQIYHNGTSGHSHITESGSGSLYVRANNLYLQNTVGATYLQAITGGSTQLRYNNSPKLATTDSGIDVTGTVVSDGLTVDGVTKIGVASAPTWDSNSFLWTKAGVGLNVESFRVKVNTGSSRIERMRIDANGDISFYDSTGVSQGFLWDASAQRLGLGATTPARKFHIQTADNIIGLIESTDADAWLAFKDNTSSSDNAVRIGATGNNLRFYAGSAERMHINSSGNVGIGASDTSLFNVAGSQAKLVVTGNTADTNIAANTDASIVISNTSTTAGNTSGLHFARADTDDTPNFAGASIVAQFPDAQATGQYPRGELAFLTSTSANAAPSEKMRISAAGNARFIDGSISQPSMSFLGDTNTGIYRPTADHIGIVTGGTQRVTINSSGIQSPYNIEAGLGSGSVAMTVNDGHGNANLCFNHKDGVPDVDGSSYRIGAAVDGTSASMNFELASSTTAGTTVALPTILRLDPEGADVTGAITATGTVTATSFVGSGASLTGVEAFPAGTKMLFGQTAAPTGWTKITTDNDAALRIVSGTVGTGGSVGLSTALATPTVTGTIAGSTGAHTLTEAQIPSHRHTITTKSNNGVNTFNITALQYYNGTQNTGEVTGYTGGGGSHSHSLSATFSSGTATINVKYVDTIMASKD